MARRDLLTTVAIVGLISACTREPSPPPISDADHALAWHTWKSKRFVALTTPGRPPSFTALDWLRQGSNTIGSDSGNDVVLPGRGIPAHVGTLIRDGARVRFEPALGAPITVDSAPAVAGPLRTDADSGGASRVLVGSAGFRIIKRVDSLGVRTWDADKVTPAAWTRSIAPFEYFALQPAWRVGGRFERRERPETVAVETSNEVAEAYVHVGRVTARVGGEDVALTAYKGSSPTDLFFTFSDSTSGRETYGFRFLHAALDTATNVVTLDFNFAYNPDCAFSPFTTCPLPPRENRMRARIAAGERAIRHLDDSSHDRRAASLAARARRAKS